MNPPILLNAPWQTFNSLNLTPYCEKTLKQKIRQTRFSSYQTWTQQAAKQEEQYMAGPLCCLSVTCQNTKWRGNKWIFGVFFNKCVIYSFFLRLVEGSWIDILIFFISKVKLDNIIKNDSMVKWIKLPHIPLLFWILCTHDTVNTLHST